MRESRSPNSMTPLHVSEWEEELQQAPEPAHVHPHSCRHIQMNTNAYMFVCDFQVSVYSRERGIGTQCLALFTVDFIDVNILEGFHTPALKFFFMFHFQIKSIIYPSRKITMKILFNYIKN